MYTDLLPWQLLALQHDEKVVFFWRETGSCRCASLRRTSCPLQGPTLHYSIKFCRNGLRSLLIMLSLRRSQAKHAAPVKACLLRRVAPSERVCHPAGELVARRWRANIIIVFLVLLSFVSLDILLLHRRRLTLGRSPTGEPTEPWLKVTLKYRSTISQCLKMM